MIVVALRRFFAPLTLAFESRSAAAVLLRDLGWTLDESFQLDALEHLDPVLDRLTALLVLIESYDPDDPDVGSIVEQIILGAGDVQEAIAALKDMTDGDVSNLISPFNHAAFWHDLALDLPEYLALTYLRVYMPPLFALLYFGGAIIPEARPAGRSDRQTLDWAAMGRLFSDPAGQISDFYDWGGVLKHQMLIDRLGALLRALGLPVYDRAVPDAMSADRFGNSGAGAVNALSLPVLERLRSQALTSGGIPLAEDAFSASLDLLLVPVPDRSNNQTSPDGLLFSFGGRGEAALDFNLGKGWLLTTTTSLDLSGSFGVEFQPSGFSLASGSPAGAVDIALTGRPETPWIILGDAGKSRLELAELSAGARVSADSNSNDMSANAALEGLQIVIKAGEGDGFIADVLQSAEVTVPINFGLDYSLTDGLTFNGGAGVEIEIVVDKNFGPAHLQMITIAAQIGTDGAFLSASASGSLTIGPFTAVLGGIGIEARFEPQDPEARGRSGAIATRIGFKPPNQIGLTVKAPGITGGGFLLIDRDEGRYAGVLELNLFGFEITAIGMIATRLPSGEEGWSLFLSISIIFPKAIPLVFGFSLSGIGGLIGVNRGIDIEALGEAVRTGNLDAVLFPQDAVANAPMILATLDTIFPAQLGQFAFGPVFQISWGAKGLVTIQLGLAIQLPDPITITLLGSFQLRIGAPEQSASIDPNTGEQPLTDIILIRADVAGTLWPTEGKLAIDAGITEGFIASLNLSGDMAVRMEFSGRPNLVAAMGGFHPDFTPPEGFPHLNRLSLKIFDEPNLRIGVEAYLAIAPNSFQFGVAAFFYASANGFKAEGRFEFDTIIIFKPFGLEARLGFQVSVSAGSVDILQVRLRGTLKGPKPWFVTGYAEFKVLGLKKKFNVELTVGRAVADGPREVIELYDLVLEALQDSEAWGPIETDGALYEAVRYAAPEGTVVFHPAGGVEINQGIAPLGIALEQFGEGRLTGDEMLLALTGLTIGGMAQSGDPVQSWYAPAHFFEMTEEEKVSSPSFEELDSGLSFGEGRAKFAPADPFTLGYESIIVDPDVEAEWPRSNSDQGQGTEGDKGPLFALKLDLPRLQEGLDLKAVMPGKIKVKPVKTKIVNQDGVALGRSDQSFSQALSNQRALKAQGVTAVLKPAYERDLEAS